MKGSKIFPIEILESDPFLNDRLNRKPFLDRLTTLIRLAPTPMVIGIDSSWGSGKTKLLEMWRAYLRAAHESVVYFNAWHADFAEEPLAPILAALRAEFPEDEKPLLEKGRRLLGAILRSAGPGLVKAATAGILDLEKPEVEEALAEAAEKVAEDQIVSFAKQAAVIEELKALLARIAATTSTGRIVIFIDELDRCRPTFAIEVLERVKHVFDAKGLVFVVALDKAQLAHSVQAVYGQAFDGAGYLGRFFDHTVRVPRPELYEFARALLTDRLGIVDVLGDRGSSSERAFLIEFFAHCCRRLQLSLREIEQCAGRLSLSILTTQSKHYLFPEAKVLLSILACTRAADYRLLTTDGRFADILIEKLALDRSNASQERIRYLDGIMLGVLLAVPSEVIGTASEMQSKLVAELESLRSQGPNSPSDRAGFLRAALEPPLEIRRGFGTNLAVEAIAFERDFVELSE